MKELIKVNGNQTFMGVEIPVVLGGFGKNKKCVSDKTIAEIHGMKAFHVRELISNNIKRFIENVDIIDLKIGIVHTDTYKLLEDLEYSKQMIIQAEHIYILSERGYVKLIKIMDSDLAWEIHDKLIDEYFELRENNFQIPQTYSDALRLAADYIEKNQLLIVESEKKDQIIGKMQPKAEYHDDVLKKPDLISTSVIAKDIGFRSAQELNKLIHDNGIIFKKGKKEWQPYAKYEWLIKDGYADYESYNTDKSHLHLKWTEKGRKWIIENIEGWLNNVNKKLSA